MTEKFRKMLINSLMILVLIVAGIVFYFIVSSHNEVTNSNDELNFNLDEDNPDLIIEPFHRTDFDENGKEKAIIKAGKVKAFLSKKVYLLDKIELVKIFRNDGSVISGKAKSGIFDEAKGNILLKEDVAISIEKSGSSNPPLKLYADDLKYRKDGEIVSSQGPVKILRGDDELRGIGLILLKEQGTLQIQRSVHSTFTVVPEGQESPITLNITADSANYNQDLQHVHYQGNVEAKSEHNHQLKADTLDVFQSDQPNWLIASGKVQAILPQDSEQTGKEPAPIIEFGFTPAAEQENRQSPSDQPQLWSVQVGAFVVEEHAQQLMTQLKAKQYDAYQIEPSVESDKLHRVRVGRRLNRYDAERLEELLLTKEHIKGFVVEDRKSSPILRGETVIFADNVVINRNSRRITCTGAVRMVQGLQQLTAQETELFLAEDRSTVTSLFARGNVRMKDQLRKLSAETLFYNAENDRMTLVGDPEMTIGLDYIKGKRFIIRPKSERYTVQGAVQGKITPVDNQLDARQRNESTAVANTHSSGTDKNPIHFKAEAMVFDRERGHLTLWGKVFMRQKQTSLYAQTVNATVNQNGELAGFSADGDVRALSDGNNLSCRSLEFDGAKRVAELTGDCRAWRGESRIQAPKMYLFTERKILQAIDGVRTHLQNAEKSAISQQQTNKTASTDRTTTAMLFTGAPIDIVSKELLYRHEQGIAIFSGKVKAIKTGKRKEDDSAITADRMEISLDKKENDVTELIAFGKVVIKRHVPAGEQRIEGDYAHYSRDKATLVVEGTKVKITDPENKVTCEKTIFDLNKNTYIIEGRDSISVHYPSASSQDKAPDTSRTLKDKKGRKNRGQGHAKGKGKPSSGTDSGKP